MAVTPMNVSRAEAAVAEAQRPVQLTCSSIVDSADAISAAVVWCRLSRAARRVARLLAVGALIGGWAAVRLDSDERTVS